MLGSGTLLKVGLGVEHHLAQQLGKLCGMLSLLQRVAVKSLGHLGVALAVGLTGHGNVHAYLATLAHVVVAEFLNHLFGHTLNLAVAQAVNGGIGHVASLLQLRELRGGSLTNGALLGGFIAFVDISTYGANKLFLHSSFVFV